MSSWANTNTYPSSTKKAVARFRAREPERCLQLPGKCVTSVIIVKKNSSLGTQYQSEVF